MQNLSLGLFHSFRIVVSLVIIADEVQETMDREMGDMMKKRLTLRASLPGDGLIGQDDIADVRWFSPSVVRRKRQYVCSGVNAAPVAIEDADRRIVCQNDGKLGARS